MNKTHFYTFMFALTLALNSHAGETSVQTLSEGACWYEEGEVLKVSSFNDKESVMMSRDEVESQVEGLLFNKSKSKNKSAKALTSDLMLHCGGYGASLIVRTQLEDRPVCLWLKFNKGQLAVRSLGGLEDTQGFLCDGYKWGELIVGVKSIDQKALLESEHFNSLVKSVSVVSGTTLKVTLLPAYHGKEVEAMQALKKQMDLKYVELNTYQHPVGEVTSLK